MCKRKDRSSNWITKHKRWLLYCLHDFTCAYCGKTIHEVEMLTLDHVIAIEMGGTNKADNLVTACRSCNAAKQERSLRSFFKYLADLIPPVSMCEVKARVRRQRRAGAAVEAGTYKRVTKEDTTLIRKLAMSPLHWI